MRLCYVGVCTRGRDLARRLIPIGERRPQSLALDLDRRFRHQLSCYYYLMSKRSKTDDDEDESDKSPERFRLPEGWVVTRASAEFATPAQPRDNRRFLNEALDTIGDVLRGCLSSMQAQTSSSSSTSTTPMESLLPSAEQLCEAYERVRSLSQPVLVARNVSLEQFRRQRESLGTGRFSVDAERNLWLLEVPSNGHQAPIDEIVRQLNNTFEANNLDALLGARTSASIGTGGSQNNEPDIVVARNTDGAPTVLPGMGCYPRIVIEVELQNRTLAAGPLDAEHRLDVLAERYLSVTDQQGNYEIGLVIGILLYPSDTTRTTAALCVTWQRRPQLPFDIHVTRAISFGDRPLHCDVLDQLKQLRHAPGVTLEHYAHPAAITLRICGDLLWFRWPTPLPATATAFTNTAHSYVDLNLRKVFQKALPFLYNQRIEAT